jgi:para-nitrobenzyl esterase
MLRLGLSSAVGAILFTALFAVAAVSIRGAGSAPTVKIDTGKLEGKSDGTISAFLGIPFGKPPVGDLRWKPPAAPANWKARAKPPNSARAACKAASTTT